jgi:anti-anti-sigma regulatory factor
MSTTPVHALGWPWLTIAQVDEDALLVTVNGGIAADRADTLWAALEEALEQAGGRLVVADLTEVTGFDQHSIDALARVTHAAVRRHLDLYVLLRSPSSLEHYARCHHLPRLWPIYRSAAAATAKVRESFPRSDAAQSPPPLTSAC